jgi:hypothetical protein
LEGLEEKMREKVIEMCTRKGWRVMDQDTGEEPKFDEITKFLSDKARTAQRVSVYDKEHTMRGNGAPDHANTTAISHASTCQLSEARYVARSGS